jgi:hypothetical protein
MVRTQSDKITISDAQLHDELIKLFESGNTDKGKCKEVLGTRFKIQVQRFYQSFNKAMFEWQELRQTAIAEQVPTNAIEGLKSAYLSKLERLEILTKIARQEIDVEEVTLSEQFGMTKFNRKPNPSEITKAIAEVNKIEGDYAPTKVAQTDKDGNDKEFNITLNL